MSDLCAKLRERLTGELALAALADARPEYATAEDIPWHRLLPREEAVEWLYSLDGSYVRLHIQVLEHAALLGCTQALLQTLIERGLDARMWVGIDVALLERATNLGVASHHLWNSHHVRLFHSEHSLAVGMSPAKLATYILRGKIIDAE